MKGMRTITTKKMRLASTGAASAKGEYQQRICLKYVTRGGERVRCDRPALGYYCELHGG